jgi:FkbM family methyltransferase
MISYAQNFEDVILNRVFQNRKQGFYIDVGAMDPVLHSVTKFFYDQGWCGINIEPNKWFFDKLTAQRERDINLNLALGDQDEIRTFYVFKEHGISTFDESSRDRFLELGFKAEPKTMQVSTLAAICRNHVDRPIDFLKIDCEGWEKLAIGGADWERFRPTVVIVEATLPLTNIPSYLEWEPMLMEAQYEMVYFDGLNRFYLRSDSPGLRTRFGLPPNVFDEFKAYATEAAELAAQAIQRERDDLAAQMAQLNDKLLAAAAENQGLRECTHALEAEIVRVQTSLAAAAQAVRIELEQKVSRITQLEKERDELRQVLLGTRLWAGQLAQDLAARKTFRRT